MPSHASVDRQSRRALSAAAVVCGRRRGGPANGSAVVAADRRRLANRSRLGVRDGLRFAGSERDRAFPPQADKHDHVSSRRHTRHQRTLRLHPQPNVCIAGAFDDRVRAVSEYLVDRAATRSGPAIRPAVRHRAGGALFAPAVRRAEYEAYTRRVGRWL